MKTTLTKIKFFIGLSFVFFTFQACKVIDTKIQPIENVNTSWTKNYKSIPVLCSTHYLKNLNNLNKSRKSPFASDSAHAKTLVFESLKELYASDSAILKKFTLFADPNIISTDTFIEVQVHVFINWWSLIPMAKVKKSVCAKSSIIANNRVIKTHEEWGFRRTLGEIYDSAIPEADWECDLNMHQLKLYCIKKSLLELVQENKKS